MVYGRRRLGKTFLLQHFFTEPSMAETRVVYYLASQSTAEVQRREFAERLLDELYEPLATVDDLAVSWTSLLRFASRRAKELNEGGRVAVVLDEFPYLVEKSAELPSILQSWWDMEAAHSPVYVVLCGSQLSAMAAMGEVTRPLHGRFNAGRLLVKPMRYDDIACFYEGQPGYSVVERLIMYGALGGTPRYHAMVRADQPWKDQLVNLLFRPGCSLEDEVRFLLSSEQIRDVGPFQAVLGAIAAGKAKHGDICSATGLASNALAYVTKVLIELGWVRKERPFGERSEARALYTIADPFVAFHHRFVARTASAAQFADPMEVFDRFVGPYLSDYMGKYVFELVCAQWMHRHAVNTLGLTPTDLGRWWSRDSQVEIDLVAPLVDGGTLFGECKWSSGTEVDTNVLFALRAKAAKTPEKSWQSDPRFVLFTAGGFTDRLRAIAEAEPNVLLVDGSMLF
jgi:AAA+ ATPase superfamily predicted ATPase